jgi:archaemetzincin
MGRIIYLQKIDNLDQSLLVNLKTRLERELEKFKIGIKINDCIVTLTDSEYNISKKQFSASKILKRIKDEVLMKEYFRILAILDEDIYSKNYNFVFGSANIKSGVALISIKRLREEFYKETTTLYRKHETKEDIDNRILKEAIHELGHTFGLKHCKNLCVMQFSDSLKETDDKPSKFCITCLDILKEVLK